MRCERCGQVNEDGAEVCEDCGMPLGQPDGPSTTPAPRLLTGWALASFLCAIFAPLSVGLLGLLGLPLGIVAVIVIVRSRARLGGEWLAIVGIVVSAAAVTYMVPAFFRAREKAQVTSCQCSLEQIALAMAMYRADWDGRSPLAHNWCDATLTHSKTEAVYVCPARPRQRCGYAYNEALAGLHEEEVGSPAAAVMVFDAYGGWNSAGGIEIVAARHDYGANIAFVDGHCMWVRSYGPHAISWDPSWTQSHPPSEQWSTGRPLPRSAKSEGEPAEESLPPDQH